MKTLSDLFFWQSDKSEIFQENFDKVQVSATEMKLDQLIETDHLQKII